MVTNPIPPFTLEGLDIRTLNFEEPAGYTASIKGSNYRYLNGAQVTVGLAGPAAFAQKAYFLMISPRGSLPNREAALISS